MPYANEQAPEPRTGEAIALGPDVETRSFPGLKVEVRDGAKPVLEGHAAVFNRPSEDLGCFVEQIDPGCFSRSLREKADVRALVDHDPSRILGRTKPGTLILEEDAEGLLARIFPPDTTAGRDVVESVRRGDLDGMSFAFRTLKDSWDYEKKPPLRTLLDVDLYDVSVVTYPAYPDTSVALRSLARHEGREIAEAHEATLRIEAAAAAATAAAEVARQRDSNRARVRLAEAEMD